MAIEVMVAGMDIWACTVARQWAGAVRKDLEKRTASGVNVRFMVNGVAQLAIPNL